MLIYTPFNPASRTKSPMPFSGGQRLPEGSRNGGPGSSGRGDDKQVFSSLSCPSSPVSGGDDRPTDRPAVQRQQRPSFPSTGKCAWKFQRGPKLRPLRQPLRRACAVAPLRRRVQERAKSAFGGVGESRVRIRPKARTLSVLCRARTWQLASARRVGGKP